MNSYYFRLLDCFSKWAVDASEVVSGVARLFTDYCATQDEIFNSLTSTHCDLDSTVQEILQVTFTSLSVLISRLLQDHLPGGVLDKPSQQLVTESKSVPNSNTMKHQRCRCLGGMQPFHIHSNKLQLLYLSVQQSQCSIIVMQCNSCMMKLKLKSAATSCSTALFAE